MGQIITLNGPHTAPGPGFAHACPVTNEGRVSGDMDGAVGSTFASEQVDPQRRKEEVAVEDGRMDVDGEGYKNLN